MDNNNTKEKAMEKINKTSSKEKAMKRYNEEGMRMTDCCGALSSWCEHVLCCKKCYRVVSTGEGDGHEYKNGPRPSITHEFDLSEFLGLE